MRADMVHCSVSRAGRWVWLGQCCDGSTSISGQLDQKLWATQRGGKKKKEKRLGFFKIK